jgi:hypothetical protein
MRKALVLLLILLNVSEIAVAQKKDNRSTMRIRLSDHSPLMITINGRDFRKTGRSLTIADIPRKRQNVQIYRFRPYTDGRGGKAELVYSGVVKLEKGNTYDCVVNLQTGKLRMRKVRALPPLTDRNPNASRTQEVEIVQSSAYLNAAAAEANVPSRLRNLQEKMDSEDADSKKLLLAQNFVQENMVTTAELRLIAGWIFFDDNRLSFLKQSYNRASDKSNFAALTDVFTLPESKEEFQSFLKGLRK